MSDAPIQHAYLHAVYGFSHRERLFEFSFARASIPGAQPLAIDLPEPWAILSARNPMSRRLDEAANLRRDRELASILHRESIRHSPAEGRSPDGVWQEPSRLVPGLTRDEALALARRFEQHALVWGERGKVGLLDCPTERWTVRPIFGHVAPQSPRR